MIIETMTVGATEAEEQEAEEERQEPSFFFSFFYPSGRDEYSCADSGIPSSTFRQDRTTRESDIL